MKGHKRFLTDLSELSAHPECIVRSEQWSVKKVNPGDEDASLMLVLVNADSGKTQTIILVVSDSSQYPHEHTYFGYSDDAGALESEIAQVIDGLPTKAGCSLREVAEYFVKALSCGGDYDCEEDDDSDEADYMMLDEVFEPSDSQALYGTPQISLSHLKKDFVEVKAAGYHPGILWTGNSQFVLSISIPTPDLFKNISPHALLAWDRRFLEPGLYLTLLISGFKNVYPVLRQDGTLASDFLRTGSALKFKLGFTRQYKPSERNATSAFREFFARNTDINTQADKSEDPADVDMTDLANDPDPGVFRRMSLSAPLESLLDQQLLRLLQLRHRFKLGWAGAEELLWQTEAAQEDPATVFQQKRKVLEQAESDERTLSVSNNLPRDPVGASGSEENILKISFVFLLRRLALSTRHCVVCHKKLREHEALRPYVCASGLCVFQYYALNLGPSVEHEIITNTGAVDLLVSLAYSAAAEGVLDEPLPRGMGLRVKPPLGANVPADADRLCEFDSLNLYFMRRAIAELLQSLPPIQTMKEYLQREFASGNTKPRLRDIDPDILPAAWSVLRWCVASCTAHIQELTKPEDRLRNLGEYRQFRFLVGAPDKEERFSSALPKGNHPTVFAFHGSPLRNWHSIIRHGLWFKSILNGRAFGHGVYFSQDASVSLGSYASTSSTVWRNSMTRPVACCTLAEIVNRRDEFVCRQPFFVVDKTEWIICRYLLVRTTDVEPMKASDMALMNGTYGALSIPAEEPKVGKYLVQERDWSTKISLKSIDVPQPSYQLNKLVKSCISGRKQIVLVAEDRSIFDGPKDETPDSGINTDKDAGHKQGDTVWKPDTKWSQRNAEEMLPPPTESSLTASGALQKELRAMMREQDIALERNDLETLGWYLPPQHNENNLYQWLVELHSFDPELPIAKDMKSSGVTSVAMEIRFPASFPHAPPFFRVIRPRFRPFMEGGGGHVTLGGSICMDLLTSGGWLPSYCIPNVLLQIKLAISSTTPRPARLQKDWDRVYSPQEALDGYIRAANAHNWTVKNEKEVRRLVTG